MSEQPHYEQAHSGEGARPNRLQQLLKFRDETLRAKYNSEPPKEPSVESPTTKLLEQKRALDVFLKTDAQKAIDKLHVNENTRKAITAVLAQDRARAIAHDLYPTEGETDETSRSRRQLIEALLATSALEDQQQSANNEEDAKLRREEDEAHDLNAQFDRKESKTTTFDDQQEAEAYARNAGFGRIDQREETRPGPRRSASESVSGARVAVRSLEELQETPKVEVRSFEEAQKIEKPFQPEFIMGLVNKNFPSRRFGSVKDWLENRVPTPQENNFIENVEGVKKFHTQLSEMVQKNIDIYIAQGVEVPRDFQPRLEAYMQDLPKRSRLFNKEVVAFYAHADPQEYRTIGANARLGGLWVGDEGDVTKANRDDSSIRSNMTFGRGDTGDTVNWETNAYVQNKANEVVSRANGEEYITPSALNRCIYLNPKIGSVCAVFEEVMQALNQAGVEAKGVMLDESSEAMHSISFDREERMVGRNKIAIYIGPDENTPLLDHVLKVVDKHKDAFEDQATSFVTQRIADGVAVSDLPTGQESLAADRAKLLDEVIGQVRTDLGLTRGESAAPAMQSRATNLFNQYLTELAPNSGVDSRNISFASNVRAAA